MSTKTNEGVSDVTTERFVLSGLCQYGKNAYIDTEGVINSDIFYDEKNQALYKVISHVLESNDKVDLSLIISTANSLKLSNLVCKQDKDLQYIRSLFEFPINLESVRPSGIKIAKLAFARRAQNIAREIYQGYSTVNGEESFDELCSIAEEKVHSLTTGISGQQNPSKLGNEIDSYVDYLQNNVTENVGVPTQFKIWDDLIGGGMMTGVHLIGARMKIGKSTFAQNVGMYIAGNGIKVLNLDTEMSKKEQMDKMLAYISGVDLRTIKTGKFSRNSALAAKIKIATEQIKQLPYYHISVAGKPFPEILSIIRRWITKEVGQDANGNWNHCLVIYDYFKLMDESQLKNMQETQAIGFQMSKLTDFTKKYDFPCLAFAQLNRDGIDKDSTAVIGDSDRLARLAVSISLLKRKAPEEVVEDGPENGTHKLLPIECRHGTLLDYGDYININFDGAVSRITELGTKFKSMKESGQTAKPTGEILF
jgi:replicative DNA helicase